MMYFEPLRYFFRDRQFLEHEVTELIHCTEPKLRGSATPCETLLFMALCSLTSTTPFLTRRLIYCAEPRDFLGTGNF